MPSQYDVVVVGAGPNGLAAAIALQQSGLSTLVVEGADRAGGGARTSALTLPGFLHDDCSSIHPLALASPFFQALDLTQHGLAWVHPEAPLAHVLDEDTTVTLERSIERTAARLGADGERYAALMGPFATDFPRLMQMFLGPLRAPEHPLSYARFGLQALRSMRGLAGSWFDREEAPALLAGIAAHAMVPLDQLGSASFALVLGTAAHVVGWPLARGGSQAITDAMLARLRALGGEIVLDRFVTGLDQLPLARRYVLDVSPGQLQRIAGTRLSRSYRERLERFVHGPGVCKVDWALSAPIPWRDPACARAATVHLSGPLRAVARAERDVHHNLYGPDPFVLVVQASLFDESRAPAGAHTGWAYCHVPHGSNEDRCAAIEAQIERFAPGFRGTILARCLRTARQLEAHNPNLVGGDIAGGSSRLTQLFFRPVARLDPYSTGTDIFLCSSSTPPGGGVHGMCGYWCAQSVLRSLHGHRRVADRILA